MEKDIIISGVKIGEHSANPDDVITEIKERVIANGGNFVYIRPSVGKQVPYHYFIEWAQFLAENKIYFHFGYTVQRPPEGKASQFNKETVVKMREIAGEYFMGDCISEAGSSSACKLAGYFRKIAGRRDPTEQKLDCKDMQEAHANYNRLISGYTSINKGLGMPHILSIEATALSKYNMEAGVDIPVLETINGDPDSLIPSVRGTARAFGSEMWGTLIAHEWYGGMRHNDMLKRKRLSLAWKHAYLSGSNILYIESGDERINSYGHEYKEGSELTLDYKNALKEISEYIKKDVRPKGGPRVKFAFVSGLHDAWGGWGGSSVWNQFHREEWGHGFAEYSWRLLDELGTKRKWSDVANYGESDFSAYPAYGSFDIVPIEAGVDALSRYEYLIFLGWNTMTDENMDKLYEYVKRGGKLLMSAAHLNYNTARNGKSIFPSADKLEKLFGCKMSGETIRTNCGTKFSYISENEQVMYPGSKSLVADPIYSAGYTEFLKLRLSSARPAGFLGDSFAFNETDVYTVVENRIGDGVATLVTSVDYPGNPALYPLYRAIVREFITSSVRNCDIRVVCNDRVRYSVYEGDKLYLLNTDYDLPAIVKVIKNGKEKEVTLKSLELKTMEI